MLLADFQKLEREARICRKLQHPNIGECQGSRIGVFCDCLQMRVLIGIIAQDTTLPVIMVNRRTVDPGLLLVDGRGRSIDLMMYEELG